MLTIWRCWMDEIFAEILAGWVERLQTRSLGAVVPAARLPTHSGIILRERNGWLNGLDGSKILGPGF
jgi:hypothetical protein